MSHDVFISYCRENEKQARLILDALQPQGIRCWVDSQNLRFTSKYDRQIEHAIRNSALVLWLASSSSIESDYVKYELATAEAHRRPIGPIYLEPMDAATLPSPFGLKLANVQSIEWFNGPEEKNLETLVREVRQLLVARRRKRLYSAAALTLTLCLFGAAWFLIPKADREVSGARSSDVVRTSDELNPLFLHWFGLAQRFEDRAWREYQVKDGTRMYDGDQYRIAFAPSADCYVQIVVTNSDGGVSRLFPNRAIQQGSFCRAGREYQVPDGNQWYTLDDHAGTETMFLVASYDSLSDLDAEIVKALESPSPSGKVEAITTEVARIDSQNRANTKGVVRTGSGIVVRNVQIEPDRRVARAISVGGQNTAKVMNVVRGMAAAVERIQIEHVHRPAAPSD